MKCRICSCANQDAYVSSGLETPTGLVIQSQWGGDSAFDQGRQTGAGEAKPFFLLGSAYNRLGRYTEAVAALERAASGSPQDADIYHQLAHAYGHLQRAAEKQKALEHFTEIKTRGEKLFESQREAARLAKEVQPAIDQRSIAAAPQKMERAPVTS